MWRLGARNDGAELRVQILKSYLQGHICEKISKKGLKNKKFGNMSPLLNYGLVLVLKKVIRLVSIWIMWTAFHSACLFGCIPAYKITICDFEV